MSLSKMSPSDWPIWLEDVFHAPGSDASVGVAGAVSGRGGRLRTGAV